MGDVYYYTALPRGGEGRGVEREREAKHSLSSFPPAYTEATRGGGELCLRRGGGGGVFAQKRGFELRGNKRRASKGPGFTGPCTEKWK